MATRKGPYHYAEQDGVHRRLPETGRPRDEILAQLQEMAQEGDQVAQAAKA